MNLSRKLAESGAKHAGRNALYIRGRHYSYRELDEAARRWAQALRERVGGRPARVGVYGSRSFTAYAGVAAALYSGAAFVPLNPRFPPARTRRMIELGQLDAILADGLGTRQAGEVQ